MDDGLPEGRMRIEVIKDDAVELSCCQLEDKLDVCTTEMIWFIPYFLVVHKQSRYDGGMLIFLHMEPIAHGIVINSRSLLTLVEKCMITAISSSYLNRHTGRLCVFLSAEEKFVRVVADDEADNHHLLDKVPTRGLDDVEHYLFPNNYRLVQSMQRLSFIITLPPCRTGCDCTVLESLWSPDRGGYARLCFNVDKTTFCICVQSVWLYDVEVNVDENGTILVWCLNKQTSCTWSYVDVGTGLAQLHRVYLQQYRISSLVKELCGGQIVGANQTKPLTLSMQYATSSDHYNNHHKDDQFALDQVIRNEQQGRVRRIHILRQNCSEANIILQSVSISTEEEEQRNGINNNNNNHMTSPALEWTLTNTRTMFTLSSNTSDDDSSGMGSGSITTSLQGSPVRLQEDDTSIQVENKTNSPMETKVTNGSVLSMLSTTTKPALKMIRSRSLSECENGQLKGILKRRDSFRSLSECNEDIDLSIFSGSSSNQLCSDDASDNMGDGVDRIKKSVRFNEKVQKTVFRPNSSILGQRRKNQRKNRHRQRTNSTGSSGTENGDHSLSESHDDDDNCPLIDDMVAEGFGCAPILLSVRRKSAPAGLLSIAGEIITKCPTIPEETPVPPPMPPPSLMVRPRFDSTTSMSGNETDEGLTFNVDHDDVMGGATTGGSNSSMKQQEALSRRAKKNRRKNKRRQQCGANGDEVVVTVDMVTSSAAASATRLSKGRLESLEEGGMGDVSDDEDPSNDHVSSAPPVEQLLHVDVELAHLHVNDGGEVGNAFNPGRVIIGERGNGSKDSGSSADSGIDLVEMAEEYRRFVEAEQQQHCEELVVGVEA